MKKASQKALAGIKLQQMLPKARVVYVSATGATEVATWPTPSGWALGPGHAVRHQAGVHRADGEGRRRGDGGVAQSLKAMGGYAPGRCP
jgi:hypothetical protein